MNELSTFGELIMQLGFGGVAIWLLVLFRRDVLGEMAAARKESREDRLAASEQASADRKLFIESQAHTNTALAILEERTRRARLEVVKDVAAD